MKKFTMFCVLMLAAITSANAGAIEVPEILTNGYIANTNAAESRAEERKVLSKGEAARLICEFYLSNAPTNIATWRDNQVPISDAHAEMEKFFNLVPATSTYRNKWHAWVEAVYKSDVTAEDIKAVIRKRCDKFPDFRKRIN